jgi:hypothetical protein
MEQRRAYEILRAQGKPMIDAAWQAGRGPAPAEPEPEPEPELEAG